MCLYIIMFPYRRHFSCSVSDGTKNAGKTLIERIAGRDGVGPFNGPFYLPGSGDEFGVGLCLQFGASRPASVGARQDAGKSDNQYCAACGYQRNVDTNFQAATYACFRLVIVHPVPSVSKMSRRTRQSDYGK
jgi:hypothetical protein